MKTHHTNGVWFYVGADAWKYAKRTMEYYYPKRTPLVLPENEKPDIYLWPVTGHDVLLNLLDEQTPERVYSIGVCLITSSANRVVVIGETGNLPHRLTLFKPTTRAAA